MKLKPKSIKILLLDIEKDGTIYGASGKPLKHKLHNGYYKVRLKNGWYPVHRLLALKYIPNPEGKAQVNHKDGDRLNNSLDNLEWVTHQENLYHAMDNGLHPWGRTSVKTHTGLTFPSQAEAARTVGACQANISRSIKTGGRCAGYYWEVA